MVVCVFAVNFWVLPRTIFHTRCKRGTTPEFVEARWVDTRGVCGEVDVADLLNAHCKGRRLCFFIPVARIPSESAGGKNAALQVSVPDTCEDTSSRKLFGVYRCVGTYAVEYASRIFSPWYLSVGSS